MTQSNLPPAAQHLCLLMDITARKPRRIGKYIMGKQLGKGAFGTVRLGKDPATGQTCSNDVSVIGLVWGCFFMFLVPARYSAIFLPVHFADVPQQQEHAGAPDGSTCV